MGGEPDEASRRSNTPSFCRISIPLNWNMCVESVSLGNSAWSTTHADSPARRRNVASGEPAHRAPTITTSKRSFVPLLRIGPLLRSDCGDSRGYRDRLAIDRRYALERCHAVHPAADGRDDHE